MRHKMVLTILFKDDFLKNLFLSVLGLHCCAWAFSSCGEQELLFLAVHRFLIAVFPLLWSMGSRPMGFSSHGSQA